MFLLQLRNELWKLFGKKRTYIGFGALLLTQTIMLLLFRFTRWKEQMARMLDGNGYMAEQFISILTVAVVMLYPLALFLFPLYLTLVGGDLVAKEAEDGTLRMILSRPISRARLLMVKWLAGAVFSFILAASLGLLGMLFASFWFPWGNMFVFVPGEMFSMFNASDGLKYYAMAHLFLAVKACTVMGLAFMFSCLNVKPAAATILALSFVFLNVVLQNIPFFSDYKSWFFTYHANAIWFQIFAQPTPWWKITESLFVLLGYNLTFIVVGLTL
ncbi:MAG: ABC transporter permease subunit, partial [Verrucomicrobiota bacterium]